MPLTSTIPGYGRDRMPPPRPYAGGSGLTRAGPPYAGGSGTLSLSRFVFVHFLLLSENA